MKIGNEFVGKLGRSRSYMTPGADNPFRDRSGDVFTMDSLTARAKEKKAIDDAINNALYPKDPPWKSNPNSSLYNK